ncbi:tol-pal system protein YbgF [Paludibacterium purpuratum]|uniref:Cell division coordinator CpoB n=1 Tax=Paludibacterium purpuratum TaxID=1144873 RepID=A0A4R7B9S8_9NEIS|nr:tol-pal system protein YbgF [Paludibacterium purpuratum]TDR80376.1 tol-pal system protein YbgF [Paludibacterium purpuratum]
MKRLAIGGALLALISGCATNADLEDTRQQINQVNQQASARLSQIETKLSNDKLLDMVSQLDDLRAQVAKLSGEVEVLNYNLQSTQKRQNDLYADLDGRMNKLEGSSSPAAASSAPAAVVPPVAGNGAQTVPDYDRALNLLRQRDFANAITALGQYIKQNPNDPQAADALFWQGVAHTALKQYDAAIAIHRQFVEQYPNHPKAPDAMRNVASCQIELAQNDEAKVTLKRLIKLYPKSAAATKAKAMLKKL